MAWCKVGNCHMQLAIQDPARYEMAAQSYTNSLVHPLADLRTRCEAEYGLGLVREKQNQPAPDTIALSNRVPGSSPIGIKGGRISYQGSSPSPRPRFGEVFSITLYSDIWFPYVLGMAHPACDYERFFDNRERSKRHTPRLTC